MAEPPHTRDDYVMSPRALKGVLISLFFIAIVGVSLSILAQRMSIDTRHASDPSSSLGKKEDRLVPPAEVGTR